MTSSGSYKPMRCTLILFLILVCLWVASHLGGVAVLVCSGTAMIREVYARSAYGGLILSIDRSCKRCAASRVRRPAFSASWGPEYIFPGSEKDFYSWWAGFGLLRSARRPTLMDDVRDAQSRTEVYGPLNSKKYLSIAIPYWPTIVLLGTRLLTCRWNSFRMAQRQLAGQCRFCGYDVRGLSCRCSECGQPLEKGVQSF